MDRIGIITITAGCNYGNRLQNFALQEFLKSIKLNSEVLTLDYVPHYTMQDDSTSAFKKLLELYSKMSVQDVLFDVMAIVKRRCLRNTNSRKEIILRSAFSEFNSVYVNMSEQINNDSLLLNQNNVCDYYICGSDQIWNPYWEGSIPFYYGTHFPTDKVLAYAASFGVERLPESCVEFTKEHLLRIPKISCRENSGCALVKQIVGIDAPVVLDPVFLLSKLEWCEKLQLKEKKVKPYILKYFLEGETREAHRFAAQLAKKCGLEIKSVALNTHESSIYCGPKEFTELILNADFVCTNSFHALAFSLIFHKKVKVFGRLNRVKLKDGKEFGKKSISSRMTDLLKRLGLEEALYSDQDNDWKNENYMTEFTNADALLLKEIADSKSFLINALGI